MGLSTLPLGIKKQVLLIPRGFSACILFPLISSLNIVSLSLSIMPQDWGIGSERWSEEKGCSLKDTARSSAGGMRKTDNNPEDFSKDFFLTIHKLDIIDTSTNLHTLFSYKFSNIILGEGNGKDKRNY